MQVGFRRNANRLSRAAYQGAVAGASYGIPEGLANWAYKKTKAIPDAVEAGVRKGFKSVMTEMKNRGYKPQKKSKAKKGPKSFPKKVKEQIKHLRQLAESDMGTLIYKSRTTDALLCASNQAAYLQYSGIYPAVYEAVLAQLRYYDPTAPSALVTADGTTGTYQKEFLVNKAMASITVVNNYQVPAKVRLYACKVKADTSIDPASAISNSLTDESNATSTNVMIYPTDCSQFNDLWVIDSSLIRTLMPGETATISHAIKKPFQYDPSHFDSHALTYLKAYQSFVFLVRVEGVIGHDTSLDEQGQLAAGVDIFADRKVEVKYDAGADIKYIYTDVSGLDTFTNGGVISSKPVSDNVGYSVA